MRVRTAVAVAAGLKGARGYEVYGWFADSSHPWSMRPHRNVMQPTPWCGQGRHGREHWQPPAAGLRVSVKQPTRRGCGGSPTAPARALRFHPPQRRGAQSMEPRWRWAQRVRYACSVFVFQGCNALVGLQITNCQLPSRGAALTELTDTP